MDYINLLKKRYATKAINGSKVVPPYQEALELQNIYDSLGIYNELATIMVPDNSNPSVLVDAGHGAWNGEVNGKGIFELSFDFLVERQNLTVE